MRTRARIARLALIALAAVAASAAHAQLRIEITSGVTDPIPIAIVPFLRAVPADGGIDVAAIIEQDLESTGRFRGMPRSSMRVQPVRAEDVVTQDWRDNGNDYALVGRLSSIDGTTLALDFELVNLLTGQRIASQRFTGPQGALRNAAHRVSDVVYEKILGVRGAFATRIAYIAVDGVPPSRRWQLWVADTDGHNARVVTTSRQPIMSPAWSPDGAMLAYVSFEGRTSSVYVQRLRDGQRTKVSARAGTNGAPSWSPDGRRLALTLGGSDGNLDIYILDLTRQSLTRVTEDPSIDTEPVWATDGKQIFFTSDRAGGPQIYRLTIGSNDRPRRVTFGGSYNARPRVSPDGRELAMVTLDGGNYRIAVQDLASSTVRVLSRGRLDESPSYAPNGAMIIYSGRDAGRTVLATVSVDGLTTQRLNSEAADVREPVWGPFLP